MRSWQLLKANQILIETMARQILGMLKLGRQPISLFFFLSFFPTLLQLQQEEWGKEKRQTRKNQSGGAFLPYSKPTNQPKKNSEFPVSKPCEVRREGRPGRKEARRSAYAAAAGEVRTSPLPSPSLPAARSAAAAAKA